MKAILLDTNVLLRAIDPTNAELRAVSRQAIRELSRNGDKLCVSAQNLIEFWNVATRPVTANGLGLNASRTARNVERCETVFRLLPDLPEVFSEWKRLVMACSVVGVKVHDSRIAATMRVHQVPCILTFDKRDLQRYGVEVLHSQEVPTAR